MSGGAKIATILVGGVVVLLLVGYVVLRLLGGAIATQEALTDQVEVRVVSSEATTWGSQGSSYEGHVVVYEYEADGRRWRDEARLTNSEWTVGTALTACVDPTDPSHHTLRRFTDVECGGIVGTGTTHADPV